MLYGMIEGLGGRASRIVLGAGWFGPERMEAVSEILDAFLAAGGTAVDTAHIYGNGASERALGKWLRESGRREDLVIITKGAHPDLSDWVPRVNPEAITQDLSESLERLGVETIDLYLLHRDDAGVPVGSLVECLNEHVAAGRIRAFGGSNWTHQRIQEANDYATTHGLQGFVASSPHLALAVARNFRYPGVVLLSGDTAALEWYRQSQFPLFSWSSQASGFFAGRTAGHYDAQDNRERLRRVQETAARLACSPTQVALAWVLNQPQNTFPIIGPSTVPHLHECVEALDVQLTNEELARLNLETENTHQDSQTETQKEA